MQEDGRSLFHARIEEYARDIKPWLKQAYTHLCSLYDFMNYIFSLTPFYHFSSKAWNIILLQSHFTIKVYWEKPFTISRRMWMLSHVDFGHMMQKPSSAPHKTSFVLHVYILQPIKDYTWLKHCVYIIKFLLILLCIVMSLYNIIVPVCCPQQSHHNDSHSSPVSLQSPRKLMHSRWVWLPYICLRKR